MLGDSHELEFPVDEEKVKEIKKEHPLDNRVLPFIDVNYKNLKGVARLCILSVWEPRLGVFT